jgi:hypothetical protein
MKHEFLGVNPMASANDIAEQVKRPLIGDSIRDRHAELIRALAKSVPNYIRFVADAQDLDDRAEHIKEIGRAFAAYVEELVDDTAYKLNTGRIDRDAHFQILDTIGDLSGQMSRIAQDLAEGSDW